MTEPNTQELRLPRSSHILAIIRRFSSTEKVIFGALTIVLIISALVMAFSVNDSFKLEIPAHGGKLKEGEVGLPRTINPVLAITDVDYDISKLVYSGLMKYEDGKIVPDLAASYSVSDDGLTYTFKLRDNVTFQDGTKLTADDVAFTIQKIQNAILKSPRRSDWVNVTVTETSPTEIKFTLKQPYSPFLTNTTVGILPKHIWGAVSDDQFIFSEYNMEPVGSGPYKVSGIVRDAGGIPVEFRLSAWGNYYGKQPYIDTMSFNFFADEDKALAALDAGSIDSLAAVSSSEADKLAKDTAQAYTVLSSPLPRVFGLFLNQNQVPVLADKNVRNALDMVLDKKAIVSSVLSGYGTALNGPLPPGFAGNTTSEVPAFSTSSITTARAMLENIGWKRDPSSGIYFKKSKTLATTTLAFDIYTADSPDLRSTADLVKAAWTTLGARVTVKVFEASDLYQNVIRTRKFDVLLFGEQIGKDRDLFAFWHSSQRNAPGLNVTMYTNSKVDKLLEEIRSSNDDDTKNNDYLQVDSQIRSDMPAIFLYSPDFIYVVPKRVHGIALDSVTVPSDRFNSISSWYTETEKVWKLFTGQK